MLTIQLPDIPLLKKQKVILLDLLRQVVHEQKDETSWYIQRHKLEDVAVRSEEKDPEDVVVWNPDAYIKQFRSERHKEDDDFLNELVGRGIFINLEAADVMWTMICETMAHCILNYGSVVNFKFARLAAFPLRGNWKEVLWDIDSDNSGPSTRQEEFERIGRNLLDEKLRAFDKKERRYQWTLEFSPNLSWFKMVAVREKRKAFAASKKRMAVYHERQVETIKAMLPTIWRAYRTWCATLNAPFFSLADRDDGRIAYSSPRDRILPAPKVRWYALPVPVWNTNLYPLPVAPLRVEIKWVSKMSEFRPYIRNLWEYNPNKGPLTWGQHAERLRLRDVAGSKVRDEELLVLGKDGKQ